MKHVIIMLFVVLSIILGSSANADSFDRGFRFIGLWQGVDPDDGSEVQRSITLNHDGDFSILGYESYYTGCVGRRGVVTATGTFTRGKLVAEDFTLSCFPRNEEDYPPGPFSVPVEYTYNLLNGTLLETYLNGDFIPEILHKISRR